MEFVKGLRGFFCTCSQTAKLGIIIFLLENNPVHTLIHSITTLNTEDRFIKNKKYFE